VEDNVSLPNGTPTSGNENLGERNEVRDALAALSQEVTWLSRSQMATDKRLDRLEQSRVFRTLRRISAWPLLGRFLLRDAHGNRQARYRRWREEQEGLAALPKVQAQRIAGFARRPVFGIFLLPGTQRPGTWRAAESVRQQGYENWRLFAISSNSPMPQELASDQRVTLADSLERAWEQTDCEYCAFLRPGDFLERDALCHVAEVLQHDAADLIYTDEELDDEAGNPIRPVFKPGWSPDLLTSPLYPGQFLVVSRSRLAECGRPPIPSETFDYELALRVSERPVSGAHVPRVLFHRCGFEPEHAAVGQALARTISRRGWHADVVEARRERGCALRRYPQRVGLASIVICSRTPSLLKRCLSSIRRMTSYERRELVVVHHESRGRDDESMRQAIARFAALRVPYSGPFDFASMNRQGAAACSGEYLVFLNDDVQPLAPEWLSCMVAQLERPEVGVVGALLLYPSGAIQHAGIAVGIGDGAGHPGRGLRTASFWPWLDHTRNVTAVTGACLGVRRELYGRLGGFDSAFPANYNDVDLCLRVRQAGLEVILEAGAVLRHDEAQSRTAGTTYDERYLLFRRWHTWLEQPDAFYTPHLSQDEEARLV